MGWKSYLEIQTANVGVEIEYCGRVEELFGAGVVILSVTAWELSTGQGLIWATWEDANRLLGAPEGSRGPGPR